MRSSTTFNKNEILAHFFYYKTFLIKMINTQLFKANGTSKTSNVKRLLYTEKVLFRKELYSIKIMEYLE